MPSNHLILCHPLLLLPSIPPSIRVFSNESALCIRWPKYWSFSFSIIPSKEIPVLISFRRDWLEGTGWIFLQSKGLSRASSHSKNESTNKKSMRVGGGMKKCCPIFWNNSINLCRWSFETEAVSGLGDSPYGSRGSVCKAPLWICDPGLVRLGSHFWGTFPIWCLAHSRAVCFGFANFPLAWLALFAFACAPRLLTRTARAGIESASRPVSPHSPLRDTPGWLVDL